MSSRKVRVKKLSVKTALPVLREDQIDPSEYEALAPETQIATGVEQAEEKEYHLQTILKDAGTSNDQEIPVPPPQESDINYDELYPSNFHQPSSYIRFSQTVEECISCQYDMTAEDNEFLKEYNARAPNGGVLSEDDFEYIMEVFEDTAAEQTPFASVDNTVVPYDVMVPGLNHIGSPSIMQHAKSIYEYWKSRRQEMGNKPIHPTLKFETHQETDDTDPYVCFRRREARQTRKTRARDNKIAETLKRLRRELEDGRQLVLLSSEREMMKRELLYADRAVFEERSRLKQMKIKLGLKDSDEDLINQKPQKRKAQEAPVMQRPPGINLRMPARPDGRSVESDLVLLADKRAEKENEFRADIELKVQNHRKWNQNHIDLTRDPLSPVKEQGMELKFRPAKTQYLMTPPASTSSEEMELDNDAPEPMEVDKPNPPIFHFKAGGAGVHSHTHQPAFRRRIGRLNRLWIDRRGLQTPPPRRESNEYCDRWAYDSDSDEDEPPVYEVDPFDARALKFRSTIPLNPYFFRRPAPQDANGVAQGTNRALPASQGQAQTPAAAASAAAAAVTAAAQQPQQPQQASAQPAAQQQA
jgi:enhancer of polycomb-like protein